MSDLDLPLHVSQHVHRLSNHLFFILGQDQRLLGLADQLTGNQSSVRASFNMAITAVSLIRAIVFLLVRVKCPEDDTRDYQRVPEAAGPHSLISSAPLHYRSRHVATRVRGMRFSPETTLKWSFIAPEQEAAGSIPSGPTRMQTIPLLSYEPRCDAPLRFGEAAVERH